MEADIKQILLEIQSFKAQVSELDRKNDLLSSQVIKLSPKGRTEDINELAAALAKAQGEMKMATLNAQNGYLKNRYADLSSIVHASRPALSKYGLSVSHQTVIEDGHMVLLTRLLHTSGQMLESRMRILPTKNDPQTLGSTITYAKRHSYSALVGVVASDEDDDAEKAMGPARARNEQGTSLNAKYDAKNESPETISKDQLEDLEYELAAYPDIAEQLLETLSLHSIADLPKSRYRAVIERVRDIKNARNGNK